MAIGNRPSRRRLERGFALLFALLMLGSTATAGVVGATTAAAPSAPPAVGSASTSSTPAVDRASLDANAGALAGADAASIQPPNFSTSTFLSNVNQPMGMAFLPDGRALVIQKPGVVEITDPDDGTEVTSTYLDISSRVNDGRERGLIDITLDPNFEENGYVYLFYTNDDVNRNRIARFEHQPNGGGLQSTADPSSESVVWQEAEPWNSCCHQGAGLDFGPEGKLWLTMGDDFNGGDVSQDLSRDGGKIIRVNKDGSIPDDNPYANDGDSETLASIWAYGLRNPFRAEWDLQSDPARLFIGDVGGNTAPDYEEVNVATLQDAGANYGWPRCEATSRSATVDGQEVDCDIDQKAPLYAYPHGVGNSITGGEVYRGQQFPERFQGAYFFGDYAQDWIKYLTFDENGDVASVETFETEAPGVNAITVGPDGSLYWASIVTGEIKKVTYVGNTAPSIDSVSADPRSAASAPQDVTFDVSASDPEGDSLSYEWTFGDGFTGTGASPTHTYQSAGTYTAYVEVTDGTHTVESERIEITIGAPPTVTIDSPADGSLFRAGDTISFSASASDPQDGDLPGDSMTWDVEFDHNPPTGADHDHPVLTNYVGASGTYEVPTSGHAYMTDTSYTLTVTATDSDGLSTTESVTVEPDKVDVTFETNPSGLDYSVDGLPQTGSVTYDTLIDFEHTVTAPATQCLDGRQYEFRNWSDGGARSHAYTVPDADATLTANYEEVGECATPVTDGLVAQYEADRGVTTSDGQVTGWADQSGQGNDLTAAGNPTLTTSPSGAQAVSFDGDGDKLERTESLNGLPSGNGDRTVILVTKYESTGYGGFAFGDAASNEAFGTVVDPNGDLMVQAWGQSNDFSSGVAGTGAGWLVQSATLDSGTLEHYKDGQLVDTRSHTYDTDLQQMVLGAEIDSKPKLDMEVAAAYVYDRALSDAERREMESHLRGKYLGGTGGETNQPPTADFHFHGPVAGQSATYHAEATDSDGTVASYEWDFDADGAFEASTASETIQHTFDSPGDYPVTLRVTDDDGATKSVTKTVTVESADAGDGDASSSLPVTDGLVLSLNASAGVSTSHGQVTGWADQSGMGNDLTANGDPTLTTAPSGAQAISFDGDGDELVRTGSLNGFSTGSEPRTMFLVGKYEGVGFGGAAYGSPNTNRAFGTVVNDAGELTVQGWGSSNDHPSGVAGTGAGWLTQSVVYDGSQFVHYRNGTQIDSGAHAFATGDSKVAVGSELGSPPYTDMQVSAVVVYNRSLSDAERREVEQYLQQRYFDGLPPVVGDAPPQNLDDDPVLEDVNGDGAFNVIDAQALFFNRNRDVVQNNPARFDFNGDGTFTVADAQAAFYQAITGDSES